MKYTWEAEDFTNSESTVLGRIVYRQSNPREMFVLGYLAGTMQNEPRYCTISLDDGQINSALTAEQMATALNIGNFAPLCDPVRASEALKVGRYYIRTSS